MNRILKVGALAVFSVVSSGVLLAQGNPLIGTWKLNPAKSKYVNTL